jgi:LuxR family maltose regulon positive regulatory protein
VHEVERTRALRALDASSSVVVLSAPAGSGKSTLAQQWVTQGARPHATVRLAAHMDDPAVLVGTIVDALEAFGPPAPHMRVGLTGSEPAFSAMVLPALEQLARSRSEPFVLVLDDIHLIASPESQRVLEVLCEAVSPGATVVLLTRTVTPDWLARVRVTGRLTELTAEQLDFDVAESERLLTRMGLTVDRPAAAEIVEHTEGWAVGVYLTGLSLLADTGTASDGRRIARGSDRIVADYLRTQVLDSLDEDRRRFLVLSSMLDELDGPLCDAVLERGDSAAMLADLHQRIQLVIAIDPDERRFRYHHLLAEELAAEITTVEAATVAGLHVRACLWFDAQGDQESAIRHATASGDLALTSRMIWPQVAPCVASGRLGRLHAWLADLSDHEKESDRWLSLAAAWAALQGGDAAAMGRWARVAERHAGPDWGAAASTDPYAASVAVLYALVGAGGLDQTRVLCELAMKGLPADDPFRAPAAFLLGVALTLQRDIDGGRRSAREAELLGRSLDVRVVEADGKAWLGLLEIADGHRDRGMHLILESADVIRQHHLDRLASGAHSLSALALVQAMLGDKAVASTTLATARRLAGISAGIAPWFAVIGRLVQARTAILLGDGATARLLISEAREHMTPDLQASSASDSLAEAEAALAQLANRGGPETALTTAELRILQFLPSHLTLQQIGEHLFVSQSTVKTHVLSIYRKFGVGSRADAVARAQVLGLVERPMSD